MRYTTLAFDLLGRALQIGCGLAVGSGVEISIVDNRICIFEDEVPVVQIAEGRLSYKNLHLWAEYIAAEDSLYFAIKCPVGVDGDGMCGVAYRAPSSRPAIVRAERTASLNSFLQALAQDGFLSESAVRAAEQPVPQLQVMPC